MTHKSRFPARGNGNGNIFGWNFRDTKVNPEKLSAKYGIRRLFFVQGFPGTGTGFFYIRALRESNQSSIFSRHFFLFSFLNFTIFLHRYSLKSKHTLPVPLFRDYLWASGKAAKLHSPLSGERSLKWIACFLLRDFFLLSLFSAPLLPIRRLISALVGALMNGSFVPKTGPTLERW